MAKELLKGNEAVAEAAIRAGLQAYFGYPITPQTEILEWMSRRMPELGRAFVQAESELGAINMVYGAACTGARTMTSSSSPGVSLMMEAMSYIAATELPAVIVDVMRGGPGLGNLAPAQADYHQIVHGGGHGDYFPLVLAPSSVQESIDLTVLAFDLAERYRTLAFILTDGSIGQMMEPAELPPMQPVKFHQTDYMVNGAMGRSKRVLTSIHFSIPEEEEANFRIMRRWKAACETEVRYQEYHLDDSEYVVVAYGSVGRIALSAVREARAEGMSVGLLRPITLAPFPEKKLIELSRKAKGILVVEASTGQMLDDVLRIVQGRTPVEFYGRVGGMVPFPHEIVEELKRLTSGQPVPDGDPRFRWLERMASLY